MSLNGIAVLANTIYQLLDIKLVRILFAGCVPRWAVALLLLLLLRLYLWIYWTLHARRGLVAERLCDGLSPDLDVCFDGRWQGRGRCGWVRGLRRACRAVQHVFCRLLDVC